MAFLKIIGHSKVKAVLKVLVLVIFVFFLYWYFYEISTGAIVRVIEVREEEIVVKNMAGDTTEVRVPPETTGLIEEGKNYFVNYSRRRWQTPRLRSIEPSQYEGIPHNQE